MLLWLSNPILLTRDSSQETQAYYFRQTDLDLHVCNPSPLLIKQQAPASAGAFAEISITNALVEQGSAVQSQINWRRLCRHAPSESSKLNMRYHQSHQCVTSHSTGFVRRLVDSPGTPHGLACTHCRMQANLVASPSKDTAACYKRNAKAVSRPTFRMA